MEFMSTLTKQKTTASLNTSFALNVDAWIMSLMRTISIVESLGGTLVNLFTGESALKELPVSSLNNRNPLPTYFPPSLSSSSSSFSLPSACVSPTFSDMSGVSNSSFHSFVNILSSVNQPIFSTSSTSSFDSHLHQNVQIEAAPSPLSQHIALPISKLSCFYTNATSLNNKKIDELNFLIAQRNSPEILL